MSPPVYRDECVDRPVAEGLRERGCDVLTALESGRGEDSDEAKLIFATNVGRVLLSYNRTEFRRLRATFRDAGREHAGILLVPQNPPVQRRLVRAAMLLDWLGPMGTCDPAYSNGTTCSSRYWPVSASPATTNTTAWSRSADADLQPAPARDVV